MSEMVLPEPTAAELDAMVNHVAVLDTESKGVNPSKLRTFYPRLGWNIIYQRLYKLVEDGRLEVKRRGTPVTFEYFNVPTAPGA